MSAVPLYKLEKNYFLEVFFAAGFLAFFAAGFLAFAGLLALLQNFT